MIYFKGIEHSSNTKAYNNIFLACQHDWLMWPPCQQCIWGASPYIVMPMHQCDVTTCLSPNTHQKWITQHSTLNCTSVVVYMVITYLPRIVANNRFKFPYAIQTSKDYCFDRTLHQKEGSKHPTQFIFADHLGEASQKKTHGFPKGSMPLEKQCTRDRKKSFLQAGIT